MFQLFVYSCSKRKMVLMRGLTFLITLILFDLQVKLPPATVAVNYSKYKRITLSALPKYSTSEISNLISTLFLNPEHQAAGNANF